jgi:uncharacterized repeat protein (TIGR03803 family)
MKRSKPAQTWTFRANGDAVAAVLTFMFALAFVMTPAAQAQTYTVLHAFNGAGDGEDPVAEVAIDAAGNLYGTTTVGGGGSGCNSYGCGTVFKLSHKGSGWIFTTLHTFEGPSDGNSPQGRVLLARDGTLYGTTTIGGRGCLAGCGIVFHLTPPPTAPKSALAPWNETIIHSFDGTDGFEPQGDLIFDQAGNIYGTTLYGGSSECANGGLAGCGTVYELTPTGGGWTETVLYAPQGSSAGDSPVGGVVFDLSGNLYGAIESGGPFNWGLVYQLSPSGSGWTEQPAYIFSGGSGGGVPNAGLISDASGNLYGTNRFGGNGGGDGTVFQLSPSGGGWSLNTLYAFPGTPSGCQPQAKLIMDAAGNLYGTTEFCGAYGAGAVFKLTPANGSWTYTSLHDFRGFEGAYPLSSLVFDAAGNLYGTTSQGGGARNAGVVFEITP